MIKNWVKIVEVDEKRVLFYLERDGNQPQSFCLHQLIMCEDGRTGEIVVGGIEEEQLPTIMDQVTEETASTVLSLLDELVPGLNETHEDSYQ